jgi:hypothetical protein
MLSKFEIAALVAQDPFTDKLVGQNFAGADLSYLDVSGVALDRATFSGANLEGSRFAMSTLSGANFTGANLVGADLGGAEADDARFDHANLFRALLDESNLRGATFRHAFALGVNFHVAGVDGAVMPDGSRLDDMVYSPKWSGGLGEFEEPDLGRLMLAETEVIPIDQQVSVLTGSLLAGRATSAYGLGARAVNVGDQVGAKRWWECGAYLGNTDSMWRLGDNARLNGDLIGEEYWYGRMVMRGDSTGRCCLAEAAARRDDSNGARRWLTEALEADDYSAYTALAELEQAEGDAIAAAGLLERRNARREAAALFNEGWRRWRDGVSDARTQELLEAAASLGNVQAAFMLAVLVLEQGHFTEGRVLLSEAARMGSTDSLRVLEELDDPELEAWTLGPRLI